MKKNKIAIIFLFVTVLSAFAFEGGGLVKSNIGSEINKNHVKGSKIAFNLKNSDGLTLWAKQNMDKDGNFNFGIQASYLFKLSKKFKPVSEKAVIKNILDLELFKFAFLLPTKEGDLKIEFGRYNMSDSTSLIMNQQLDGFFISYNSHKKMNITTHFSLAYTGLLNSYTTPIVGTFAKKKQTKIYNLAPGFIATNALVNIPLGRHNHSISVELDSFIQTKAKGLAKNYLTVLFNGPIYSNLYFIASGTGVLRAKSSKVSGGGSVSGDIVYYFTKLSSKVGVKSQWFSGGANYFTPFTYTSVSKMKSKLAKDIWKTSIYASLKPVDDLFLGTDVSLFLAGEKVKGQSFYRGAEFNIGLNYTILSDIFIGFDSGVFINNEKDIDAKVKLKVKLSF